jgi:hypothetical protein
MNKKSISQSRTACKQPLTNHPQLTELLVDLAIFTRKWQTPQIAKTVGVKRQSLEYHIDKKEGQRVK